jgi:SAM-dependent methyltransferase
MSSSAAVPAPHVVDFYDEHIVHKVADFVDGNRRVDAAWRTLEHWAPESPRVIVEIGCGLGAMAYRMADRWPNARVIGADISPRSIEYAQRLFQLPNLAYSNGSLDALAVDGYCDLVVLVDVYEHIAHADRAAFLAGVAPLLSDDGRAVLTFPTPAYQRILRECSPEKLQPVDEDVDMSALDEVGRAIRADLVMYQEHDIWLTGDYGHAVFMRRRTGRPVVRQQPPEPTAVERAVRKVQRLLHDTDRDSRDARLQLVERTLGAGAYRPR